MILTRTVVAKCPACDFVMRWDTAEDLADNPTLGITCFNCRTFTEEMSYSVYVPENHGFLTLDSGKREQFDTGAKRDTQEGKGRYDLLPVPAIRRLAQLLERGAVKYGERNWEKGIPVSRCLSYACRHLFQLIEGEPTEDHAAAVLFNVSAVIFTREMISRGLLPAELDDVTK
jgi:hypothetical protein